MTTTSRPQCMPPSGGPHAPPTGEQHEHHVGAAKAAGALAVPRRAPASARRRLRRPRPARRPAHSRPGPPRRARPRRRATPSGRRVGRAAAEARLVHAARADHPHGRSGRQIGPAPPPTASLAARKSTGQVVGELRRDALGVPGADAVVGQAVDPIDLTRRRAPRRAAPSRSSPCDRRRRSPSPAIASSTASTRAPAQRRAPARPPGRCSVSASTTSQPSRPGEPRGVAGRSASAGSVPGRPG
jgi:hypothetical protein